MRNATTRLEFDPLQNNVFVVSAGEVESLGFATSKDFESRAKLAEWLEASGERGTSIVTAVREFWIERERQVSEYWNRQRGEEVRENKD